MATEELKAKGESRISSKNRVSKLERKAANYSHIVTIFQKPFFLADAQAKGAPEFMSMAKKSLGSYFQQSTSKAIGSGLTFAEQKLLMPKLVDCEPEDRNFRDKVQNYFANIRVLVPYGDGTPGTGGKKLEIGLENSSDPFDLDVDNMPINPAEYLIYRWALGHPWVAASLKEGQDNMLTQFYIHDEVEAEAHGLAADFSKDKATEYYLKLKNEPQYLNMVLTLMDIDPRIFKGPNAEALKLAKAKELSNTQADKFVKIYDDKTIEQQYQIQSMVNTKVLVMAGKQYINPETTEVIGHDLIEAITYLKDSLNSQSVLLLLARMQEALGLSQLEKLNQK